jgi:type IV secretory pathway component VirB8
MSFFAVCPILWFLSIFVILCPLDAPADWEQSKTPAQRARLLARMRATEVRWARRSLFAAFSLCVTIAVVVSVVVVVTRR